MCETPDFCRCVFAILLLAYINLVVSVLFCNVLSIITEAH